MYKGLASTLIIPKQVLPRSENVLPVGAKYGLYDHEYSYYSTVAPDLVRSDCMSFGFDQIPIVKVI